MLFPLSGALVCSPSTSQPCILPSLLNSSQGQLPLLDALTEKFPSGPVVKNPLANAGDMGSIPGLGRSHMP